MLVDVQARVMLCESGLMAKKAAFFQELMGVAGKALALQLSLEIDQDR